MKGICRQKRNFMPGVSSVFRDGDVLTLYQWGEDGNLEPAAEDISVENGYVTFSLDHCSSYVLTGASPAKGSIKHSCGSGDRSGCSDYSCSRSVDYPEEKRIKRLRIV